MDQPTTIMQTQCEDSSSSTLQHQSLSAENAWHDSAFTELSKALAAAEDSAASYLEYPWLQDNASQHVSNDSSVVSSPLTPGTTTNGPKLGSRFSREVIRTLKQWLVSHQHYPYPTEDEMSQLQQKTGMNKAQLINWFANARRRGKLQSARAASPRVHQTFTSPIDIIARPATPAVRQDSNYRNPMQRWVESPPEHEPAAVSDIARAVVSSSGTSEDYGTRFSGLTYNDPWRSPHARSPPSSAGTSLSSEASNVHSSDSQSSLKLGRVSRRKRALRRQRISRQSFTDPSMPFQCTFCTEVFRTKHDWQRHEKSMHLPLEQWICTLHGPRAIRNDESELCCVFCGESTPDDVHIERHHYKACQERDLAEHTFHRKDHLVQHLRLVHNAKFEAWSMKSWMVPMPNIQSRCGFCSATMSTWMERVDHLADHFKAGLTMASWKGDQGFTSDITRMVESAVPPYMIEFERRSLMPMKASDPPWGSPPNAYELLKVEIEYFVQNYFDRTGQLPTDDETQLEACRILFAADVTTSVYFSEADTVHQSWLRDLIMSSEELTRQARFGPIRTSSENRHACLNINGKDYLFEQCTLETELQAFVLGQQLCDRKLEDSRIQNEACEIVRRMEKESAMPSEIVANWLSRRIYSGVTWLANFKRRAGVLAVDDFAPSLGNNAMPHLSNARIGSSFGRLHMTDMQTGHVDVAQSQNADFAALNTLQASNGPTTIFDMQTFRPRAELPDDTNFFRSFESDLKRWVAATMSPRNPNCHVPSDEEIQHQARWIVYGGDDPWNTTPADFAEWLSLFRRDVGITQIEAENCVDPTQLVRHAQE